VIKNNKETVDDLINTRFKVYVKMKQTAYERQLLENNIKIAMQTIDQSTGKPLISFKDAFTIREISNSKLAQLYLSNKIEENEQKAAKQKQADIEANAKLQKESNDQAAQKAIQLQKDKLKYDERLTELQGRNRKEEILLEKGLDIWKAVIAPKTGEGGITATQPQLPPELKSLLNLTFQSVAQSLSIEINKSEQQIQEEQAEQEALMQAAAEQQAMSEQEPQMMQ
jgi:hypothetical protein